MPSRARLYMGYLVTSVPEKTTRPLFGLTSPTIM